jgi:hypothetical protein
MPWGDSRRQRTPVWGLRKALIKEVAFNIGLNQ